MTLAILHFVLKNSSDADEFASVKTDIIPRVGELVHINIKSEGWGVYEVMEIDHFLFDRYSWAEEMNKFPIINIYVRKFEELK
jgi:hypothetical protein